MKKFILTIFVTTIFVACGGQVSHLSKDDSKQLTNSTSCLACPSNPPSGVVPFNPYFNSTFAGQVWAFENGNGLKTWFTINTIPPSNFYQANTLVMNITKNDPNTYWLSTIPNASIDFTLSQLSDGSYNSTGWVLYFPTVVPSWLPCHASPCSEEVQPVQGQAMPYLIVPPPSIAANTTQITETSYNRWDSIGANWNSFVSGPPTANIYWKTAFSMTKDGLAVSEQWEGDCGHEKWFFKANVGLVKIESPNDGHGTATCPKPDPINTIDRIF